MEEGDDEEQTPNDFEEYQKPSREILNLLDELASILETYSCLDPQVAEPHMARAKEIQKEIQRAGYPIYWTITINPKDPLKPKVDIEIRLPKKIMTPDEKKKYDAWFSMVNGLPSPDKDTPK